MIMKNDFDEGDKFSGYMRRFSRLSREGEYEFGTMAAEVAEKARKLEDEIDRCLEGRYVRKEYTGKKIIGDIRGYVREISRDLGANRGSKERSPLNINGERDNSGLAKLKYKAKNLEKEIAKIADEFASRNIRLVKNQEIRLAKKYDAQGNLGDITGECNYALYKAVERFDFDYGGKFSTFAVRCMKRAVMRFMLNQWLKKDRYGMYSLDNLVNNDESGNSMHNLNPSNVISPYEDASKMDKERVIGHLNESLKRLSNVELAIIKCRFGIGSDNHIKMTLDQVGQIIGVTKERVRQIEIKILKKLRPMLEEKGVESRSDF